MKPSVLVAVGCSWVAAKCIDRDPTIATPDYDHVEDSVFVQEHSFAGQLQRRLGLDQLHFIAREGASNEEQVRKLIAFVEANQDQYSDIFVLWGITSIYRWEMYSASTDEIESCMVGRRWAKKPELTEQVQYYFKHFFNRDYELEKLGISYLIAHSVTEVKNFLDSGSCRRKNRGFLRSSGNILKFRGILIG